MGKVSFRNSPLQDFDVFITRICVKIKGFPCEFFGALLLPSASLGGTLKGALLRRFAPQDDPVPLALTGSGSGPSALWAALRLRSGAP